MAPADTGSAISSALEFLSRFCLPPPRFSSPGRCGCRRQGLSYFAAFATVLKFTDGRRTVAEIRDAVSAELEPVSVEAVTEYLELLARAEVVQFRV